MVVFFSNGSEARHQCVPYVPCQSLHQIARIAWRESTPTFDGIYDMQMLLVMEFSIAMSKVPIKNRDFDSIQDEIWRDLGFSLLWVPCYFGKGYTISAEIICYCIHIYIYTSGGVHIGSAPPHPGCQTMLQLHYIFRIGKPMILATVSGWGVHPIYDILCIDFFIHNKVKLIDS